MKRMCKTAAVVTGILSFSSLLVAQHGPQIAFASTRSGRFQVWKVDPVASATALQVTTAGGGNQESREPDWSANGRIAYQFGASGVRGIHLIKPDGTGDVQLTTSGGDERDPSWSPDGRFIAYASLPTGATDYDIWIHDTNNTPDDPSDDKDYVLLTRPGTQELRPAWSRDGNTIAFVTSSQIATVPVHFNPSSGQIEPNGSVVMLTSNSFINFDPTWSPDNQQIAYSTTRNGGKDIYRMSAALGESQQTQLTTNSANDSNPSWSLDGLSITFVTDRDGSPEIYRMSAAKGEADTNNLVRITNDLADDDEDPVWEPLINGADLSRYSGDVLDNTWKEMVGGGIHFVMVQAWGGGTPSPCAQDQLVGDGNIGDSCNNGTPMKTSGAQNNGLLTGAYAVVTYLSNGGDGAFQINQALAAVGLGLTNLKSMVVDVEPCCGAFVNWIASHNYAVGNLIEDPQFHIQKVKSIVKPGLSGVMPPAWNDSGQTTPDNEVTWIDTGEIVLDQASRVTRICEAVSQIQAQTQPKLQAIIYTSAGFWQTITGNAVQCPAPYNTITLTKLPLWDTETKPRFKGLDGINHCGDGFLGLAWQKNDTRPSGWLSRSGNQYDTGPVPKPHSCGGNPLFGIRAYDVDLDYFDSALFQ